MSSTARNISGGGNRKSSRLQRRAPPPLKINPSEANWKVPIPLLSPTESPPPKPPMVTKRDEQRWGKEVEKPPIFKKWQHPAAPFYYQPAPSSNKPFAWPN
ncbi:hypothetical protein HID58_063965 [Brassica napus]|uniref:BnaC05g02420D protein n=3 Tax=Brassica TaxID=3705 RepID=A0A078FYI5_BRANA|nr:PREDICTED: uncharacterized protein At4g14450, chloroplastic [Brassica oleracea var. oleracea]XP_022559502.1 uncharacterized protein At4g14450, chloroplastic-like [Brassica napus]KAH0876571.1 hypothetical protein HID58_063965 [Brassica napus]CAF1923674.1 unnamed protein product [Brassica napus]CDY18219.1 BnaC05g02420D [Brassica napus]